MMETPLILGVLFITNMIQNNNEKRCLDYEIYMFRETCIRLQNLEYADRFLKNSLVESLALHARVLIDFFYSSRTHDDIIAQDFFTNIDWARERPIITKTLDEAKMKANKQLAHLSRKRINLIKNNNNGWRVAEIERDINLVIERFEELIKKESK